MIEEEYLNKKISVILINGRKYTGKVIDEDDIKIKILDKYNLPVIIRRDMISETMVNKQ
jgi:hypothetical protein